MDDRYQEIQTRYLTELKAVMPAVINWWDKNLEASQRGTASSSALASAFERRWPAGPAAHPAILHVFRKYFLEVDNLNLENEMVNPKEPPEVLEAHWGDDSPAEEVEFILPVDLLINDIESVAPKVFEIIQGLVFIPVGLDPNEEFC